MIRIGPVGRPLREDTGRVVVYVPRPRGSVADEVRHELPAFPPAA